MSTPCKETRLRVRCCECGRIMHSHDSRVRGICGPCQMVINIRALMATEVVLSESEAERILRRRIFLRGPKSPPLKRMFMFLNRPVRLKDAKVLHEVLSRHVIR